MKRFIKKYAGILYIVLAGLTVLIIIFSSRDMPDAIRSFGRLNPGWIWACVAVMLMYLGARCATLIYYLRRQSQSIKLFDALIITGKGQFYSAVTPSASGGQPAQVLAMHRLGIPLSTATATVSVKFLGFQIAVLLIGTVSWFTHWDMVRTQLSGIRYIVVLGYVLNAGLVAAVGMTAKRSLLINRMLNWCVHLAARMHIVKNEENVLARAHETLEEYRSALMQMTEHPLDALVVLGLSLLQIVFLMSVPVCLYHAFGLHGWGSVELFTLQTLLFIAASFVPLPGAAGAQEGGFYLFFQGIFPEGEILAAMLCWRLFTYYFLMLFGLLTIVADGVRKWMGKRKQDG